MVMAERMEAATMEMLAKFYRMPPAEVAVAEAAISNYTPSPYEDEDAEYQRAVMSMMRQCDIPALQRRVAQEEVVLRIAANGGTGHHPFRCLPLSVALSNSEIFSEGKPNVLSSGRKVYELSSSSQRASHFISHCWSESGQRKAELLREFLCLQPMLIGIAMTALLLTLLLLPLGFALIEALPNATLIGALLLLLPLLALLAVLGWVYLSAAGKVPVRLTPWALQDEPIWMENACVDEDKIGALMRANFSTYLQKSDRMIAFVSKAYFSRLWCVYELATFCRKYQGPLRKFLDQDLMLLSVEWSDTLAVFSSTPSMPTPDELEPLRSFSCREATCLRASDRAVLLADIRREWGSEAAFDAYVQAELPAIYASNKLRYSQSMATSTADHLDLAFGD